MDSKEVVVPHIMLRSRVDNIEAQTGCMVRKWTLYWSPGSEPFFRFRLRRGGEWVPGHVDVPISDAVRFKDDDYLTFRSNYSGRDMCVKDEENLK